MIYVVVSVRAKPGKLQEFLDLFKSVAPKVRQEKGCVQYLALVDMEVKGIPQSVDKDVVTILEQWESLEALGAHARTPHMAAYFKQEKEFVDQAVIRPLKEA